MPRVDRKFAWLSMQPLGGPVGAGGVDQRGHVVALSSASRWAIVSRRHLGAQVAQLVERHRPRRSDANRTTCSSSGQRSRISAIFAACACVLAEDHARARVLEHVGALLGAELVW